MAEDLYAVLGVPADADIERIKAAWREIARRLHPDRNPGDVAAEAEFRRASAAWAVLSDPDKRLVYDRFGIDAVRAGVWEKLAEAIRAEQAPKKSPPKPAPRPEPRPEPRNRPENPSGRPEARADVRTATQSGDVRVVGPGQSSRGGPTSIDARAEVVLTLREAATGAVRIVQVEEDGPCGSCGGTGLRASGRFCNACRGSGRAPSIREVRVALPVSVASGTSVRVPGEARLGSDGRRGTLYVDVTVTPDATFRREGSSLYVDVRWTPGTATVEVPTLDGPVTVDVPDKARVGSAIRLVGKGMPGPKGRPAGDLWATLHERR